MAKHSCSDIQELLYDYVDGLLSDVENVIVAHHLETCEECQKELEIIKKVSTLIASIPDEPLPEDFDEKLHNALVSIAMESSGEGTKLGAALTGETEVMPFVVKEEEIRKLIWQRSWFPRTMAASVVLLFGIVSISFAGASGVFNSWALNNSASKSDSYQTAANAENGKLLMANADLADGKAAKTTDSAQESDADVLAKTYVAAAGTGEDSRYLASRDQNCVEEYMSLLSNKAKDSADEKSNVTSTPPKSINDTSSNNTTESTTNNGMASLCGGNGSGEAADENYYWQNYDYAKLTILPGDGIDILTESATIATSMKGQVCEEFFDINKDETLNSNNSIMIDVPADTFNDTLDKLNALGTVDSSYIPDKEEGEKFYTYESNGIVYRSIVIVVKK